VILAAGFFRQVCSDFEEVFLFRFAHSHACVFYNCDDSPHFYATIDRFLLVKGFDLCPIVKLEVDAHCNRTVGFVELDCVADNLEQSLVVNAPVCVKRLYGHLAHANAHVQIFEFDALAELDHELFDMVFDALGLLWNLLKVQKDRFVLYMPSRQLCLMQVTNLHGVAPNTTQVVLRPCKHRACPISNALRLVFQQFCLVRQRILRRTEIYNRRSGWDAWKFTYLLLDKLGELNNLFELL